MPVYFVRHGETDYNRDKRFQSRTDVPLNALGLSQAQAIRDELRRRQVRFIKALSSPLSRALDTARVVLEGTGLEATPEPALLELDFGLLEGRLETELRQELGEEYTRWRQTYYTVPPPGGGESIISAAPRVKPVLTAIAPKARDAAVLLVGHQAIFMAAKVALTGLTDLDSAREFKQNNNEVEVWNVETAERLERFTVHPAC